MILKKYLSFLKELDLKQGQHYRGDCPLCGGDNTFSASYELGTLLYHCFRASCTLSGSINKEMTNEDIISSLDVGSADASSHYVKPYVIPDHFVKIGERKECIEYLRRNHCLSAYYAGRADIRYDPKQNRVVFLIKEGDVCYDAVGRSLDRHTLPKWFRYGTSTIYYRCSGGKSDNFVCCGRRSVVAILVEDCASACAVSCVVDGIALLGSQLGSSSITNLLKYDEIIVALDKDAGDKSFNIQRYLSFYCKSVKILLLERDLKYLNEEEIKNEITRIS